jgi:hypothetical protein
MTNGTKLDQIIDLPFGTQFVDQLRSFLRSYDQFAGTVTVIDTTLTDPTGLTPNNGDAYYVGSGAVAPWNSNTIQVWREGQLSGTDNEPVTPYWEEYATPVGLRIYDQTQDTTFYVYSDNNLYWFNNFYPAADGLAKMTQVGNGGFDYLSFKSMTMYDPSSLGNYFFWEYDSIQKGNDGFIGVSTRPIQIIGRNATIEMDVDNDGKNNIFDAKADSFTTNFFDASCFTLGVANATITAGAITPTSSTVVLDILGGIGDLTTINGSELNQIFILSAANGQTITVKHGTFKLAGSADFVLDNIYKTIVLQNKSGVFCEISRSNNGA